MPYAIRLPDGTLVENIPDEVTPEQAKQRILKSRPDLLSTKTPIAAPEEESGFFRQALDVPVGIAKGAVQGVRMVADAFGAGSAASNAIRGVENYIGDLMSAESKKDSQEIARIMKEAEDKGVGDQLKAALNAFMTAPVDLISQGLGTAAPVILSSVGAKVLGGAALAGRVGLGLGATMGAGTSKGVIYEETKQALKEAGLSEEQAEARAQAAQSYGGQNLDMILAGTALGGLGAVTGIEKPAAAALARRIMGKAAATEAAEQVATEGVEAAAKQGIARRYGTAMATEGAPEFLQGGQEQMAGNVALAREGFDVDAMRGVIGAGALEGLVGAGMGAGVEAVTGGERPAAPPPAETVDTTEEIETPDTTETEEPTTSLRDIFNPPPPPSPEEIKINELQTRLAELNTQIEEMQSRPLTKDEKKQIAKLRNEKKAKDQQLADLQAKTAVTEPTTPGEPLGTQTTETVQTETQGQETPAAGPAVTDATQTTTPAVGAAATPTTVSEEQGAVGTSEAVTPDMIVPSDVSLDRPSDKEISEEIKQKEAQVASLYDEEIEYAKLDDEGANLYDALKSNKLPDDMQLGSLRLQDVLERNELDLPDLPDNFETLPAQEQQQALEEAKLDLLKQIEDKRAVLLPWNKLTVDQRQVYLDNIRDNTAEEHAKGRRALVDYRRRLREAQGKPKDLKASPEAGIYERNRNTYKTRDRLEYPAWNDLTDEQRALYDQTLRNRQADPSQATTEDHDAAFKAVADKLVEEGYVPTPGMTYADVRAAQLKQSEQQSKARAQKEIREEREGKKERTTKQERPVPKALLDKIKEGDLNAVLLWLSNSIPNPNKKIGINLQRLIAAKIKTLKLNTKIQLVDTLPNGDLAQYDPNTDTILVTEAGATPTTLLHELVHAATIKVLDKVAKNDPTGLTESQIDAANQLDDIMAMTSRDLSEEFPEAYTNIFEFVSNALSNVAFQDALKKYPAAELEYTLMPERGMLSRFMEAVVDLLNIRNLFTPSGGIKRQNLLAEAISAFESIIEVPEGGIERAPLPATQPKQTKKAQGLSPTNTSLEQALKNNALPETSTKSALKRMLTGRQAYLKLRKLYQNSRDVLKRTEAAAALAEKIEYWGPKINSVYNAIVGSTGIARNYFLSKVEPHEHALRKAIGKYAEKMNISPEDAAVRLHLIALAFHDGERRDVLYMFNVPLSTKPVNITLPDGTVLNMAPSEFRIEVMKAVFDGKLSKADLVALRKTLDSVVQQYVDPFGFSGIDRETGGPLLTPNPATPYTQEQLDNLIDRNSVRYNTGGQYSPAELAGYKEQLYTDENKAIVDEVMRAVQALQKATVELNKEANYWSKPVQSVVDFYGWEHYIPLKGKQKFEKNEEFLQYNDVLRLSRDLQESQDPMGGRQSDSDNSLLQSMVDATRAALRAGRKDVTLSIMNAVKAGIIQGEVFDEKIPFADRRSLQTVTLKDKEGNDVLVTGQNFIYHYNSDGSIQVIKLTDQEQREAIKRTYEAANPLIDRLNLITSTIGQLHTRYNLAFAPMNFVRDALTHAFMLGASFGPKAAAQYITAIAVKVAGGGLKTAGKVSMLYENGQMETIKQMAKKDPYVAAIYEYLEAGGKISYLSGISSKGQQIQLQRDLSSSNLKTAKAAVDKLFDVYNDMFELSARAAAYQIAKEQALAEKKSPKEAQNIAMGYAKELANFESVGAWGKGAGAMFMFFRPAATGAVRAIDAIAPMFKGSLERAKADLPPAIRNDKEAMAKFEKNFKQQAKNAKAMSGALVGMGAVMYLMAYIMADDDEYGRNKVATDDMNRWQRYARFYIPGTENALKGNAFQIPWGFGLGAFASAGAQFAALLTGNNSVKDALTNTMLVGMDSFLPLPVSKISPMEHPAAWLMDSAMPSALRPFLEWTMNVDGLGREIYNNRSTRYSDAYTGGDNIPELYKSAARTLYEITEGKVDWSPNTMFFFANNYMDGIARLGAGAMNISMVATNDKDFNLKTDTMLFDSFFGTPSNVDAREFAEAEQKILNIQKRLKTMEDNQPEMYAKYVEKNPMHPYLVETYNVKVNQILRDLRRDANIYRRMPGLTPKERTDIVKNYVSMQNLIKRDILNTLEALGLED